MGKHDLYLRLVEGDETAFTDLYATLNPSLIRVAAALTGNHATAEEVAQDTWMAVFAKLNSFDGRSSLKNWIFAILTNKSRSRAARDNKTVSLNLAPDENSDDEIALAGRFNAKGVWTDPPSLWEEITPERILGDRQVLEIVNQEISALPKVQGAILSLVENQKMSSRRIGEILGLSESNVRVHLHRARERMRRVLEPEMIKGEKKCNDIGFRES